MRRLWSQIVHEQSGQVGSAGVAAAVIPTAVLGAQVSNDALPATGVAIGLFVVIALTCIMAGVVLRWQSARMARRAV